MSLFTAKKNIPASEIGIKGHLPKIHPPGIGPAKADFHIPDVKPVSLTDAEYKNLITIFIKIAKRSPDMKNLVESIKIKK